MKGFTHAVRWVTAAALFFAMPAVSAFAAKESPATDKNVNVPVVPRAIPDLNPYHLFEPPQPRIWNEQISDIIPPTRIGAFDIRKLTISGDMRIRPEMRNNSFFGVGGNTSTTPGSLTANNKQNLYFTQQLVRLGFNYAISPDVDFFFQAQVANTFGATGDSGTSNTGGLNGAINPNTGALLFMRQGFMLVRNFVIDNLTLKAGRQLVVWGNHRIFGHFDWNNIGFAFDGVTMRYNHPNTPLEFGWLRVAEGNCGQNGGGCGGVGGTSSAGPGDGDIIFVRMPGKFGGIAFEPAWIWESGGAGASGTIGGQTGNQSRHTVGFRAAGKKKWFDATVETYYQFGSMGLGGMAKTLHINAFAFHADAGVTLPVPMQPRVGVGFEYGSGDGSNKNCTAANQAACNGNINTFSQLFPTNHIHFGYMDLMSWQNMVDYTANLQMRPTKNSHFEIAGHIMRLANTGDNWYTASQAVLFNANQNTANAASVGQEIDAVYTLFFQNNRVAWQLGYGHFFAGAIIKNNLQNQGLNNNAPGSDWGYTQLWINF